MVEKIRNIVGKVSPQMWFIFLLFPISATIIFLVRKRILDREKSVKENEKTPIPEEPPKVKTNLPDATLVLVRTEYPTYTSGKLYLDGQYFCDTLEDVVREKKVYAQTAIPYGTYSLIINYSNRFKKNMPRLLNVPNFDGILIHSGNTTADTSGCILVGTSDGNGKIVGGSSRPAFNNLFAAIENRKNMTIAIIK